MKTNSNFDSGNIEVLEQKTPDSIAVKLKNDNQSAMVQFPRRVNGWRTPPN
ncbi:MAG: hypothetical protein ACI92E_000414 [Oceanicoccus sp.]|jgi:hypothetical protein